MKQEEVSPVKELFTKAEVNGGFEYLYVLVRIDGIQCYDGYKDELVVLRDWLKTPDTADLHSSYRFLAELPQPLELLQNLVNVATGNHYQVRAFLHLKKGTFPKATWPNTAEKVESLINSAKASGFSRLADLIASSYRVSLLGTVPAQTEDLKTAFNNLVEFLKELIDLHFSERLKFKDGPKYIKIPGGLDVLEFLMDDQFGLNGLRVHFSQNCTADFMRTPKGVFGTNIEFGPPVTFLMMSLEPSTNEYRVNGKRLYEIGLPGRYNKLGEWKPLIYPGNADHLVKESMKLSEDPDVQGTLFYMRLTGHKCIEFVLRTNIEMPGPYTCTKEENLHVWKCPTEDYEPANKNVRVYDCWLELNSDTVEDIEHGLSAIAYFVNVLCFPFGAAYSWRVKYRMTTGGTGLLTPSHDDLKIVDEILKKFPDVAGGAVLASGIDWYNRGSMSTNIFNRFLCYYIALESVATAIADGTELRKTPFVKPTKGDKKACIEERYQKLFSTDPIRFVIDSYFECVQTLTAKTKAVVESVFGKDHPYLKLLFEQSSGGDMPLKDLRADLAHGDVTLMDKQHEHLIHKHIYEMERITREFLFRILFRLEPSEKVPSWSGQFQQSFSTADPRSTMVSSTETVFPKGTDWKIRAEWCE